MDNQMLEDKNNICSDDPLSVYLTSNCEDLSETNSVQHQTKLSEYVSDLKM